MAALGGWKVGRGATGSGSAQEVARRNVGATDQSVRSCCLAGTLWSERRTHAPRGIFAGLRIRPATKRRRIKRSLPEVGIAFCRKQSRHFDKISPVGAT